MPEKKIKIGSLVDLIVDGRLFASKLAVVSKVKGGYMCLRRRNGEITVLGPIDESLLWLRIYPSVSNHFEMTGLVRKIDPSNN